MLVGHGARLQARSFTASGDLVPGADEQRSIRWSLDPRTALLERDLADLPSRE